MSFWDFFASIGPKLGMRREGFRQIFERLDQIKNPVIIETGCVRRDDSWSSDGSSTRLFDAYIQTNGGRFITIDIDPVSTACAQRHCQVAKVITADSVETLKHLAETMKADLLYLDSFDFESRNPLPSARHHLQEIEAAEPMLKPETMIVVDDCFYREGKVNGKGALVSEFAAKHKLNPFLLDYQCGWTGYNAQK